MSPFWSFARRMLRYRVTLLGAIVFALVSAGGLGAGLLGIYPVLEAILGQGRELPQLAQDLNVRLARVGIQVPSTWVAALPAGRFTAVVWVMSGLGILTVIGGTANFLHQYLSLTVVQRTVANIRREAFHRVLRLPLRRVVSEGASDTVSRIVNDTNQLDAGLTALLSKAVAQVTKGAAAVAVAFIVHWVIALVAIPTAFVLYLIIRKLGKRIRRASRSALTSQAGLYGAASQALQGLRVVKVHTTERLEAGRFHRFNKEVMRQMLKVRTARALSSPLVEVVSIVVVGALTLLAAWMIIHYGLDQKQFMLTLGALCVAGASVKPLTGIANDIQASGAAAGRLQELMEFEPEPGHDRTLPALPPHRESIGFRAVWFTYPRANQPALRDVNLTIRHGERVAFVGPNGSGKTTLLSLVPRLFDPDGGRGSVLIDGRDVRLFAVRSLRRQIGVVTQETVLFRGTIRENIAYGADDASDERVEAAARRARAREFIEALPQGYGAMVGEQGLTLSGGQRQRLAIARAILRDPSILILDEATSMIDADSEARIAEAVAEFSVGRTCLIVAHRLSTVLGADRIVVMDAGRIVDEGSHADLLTRCAVYRLIAERQLVGSAPETITK